MCALGQLHASRRSPVTAVVVMSKPYVAFDVPREASGQPERMPTFGRRVSMSVSDRWRRLGDRGLVSEYPPRSPHKIEKSTDFRLEIEVR